MIKNTTYFLIIILVIIFFTGCEDDSKIELTTAIEESKADIGNVVTGKEEQQIFVYISGEVNKPGVYPLPENSRLYQAIDKAGGMTSKAQKDYLNLAEKLTDGQKVQVLSKKQYAKTDNFTSDKDKGNTDSKNNSIGSNNGNTDGDKDTQVASEVVNINTATVEQLTTLPGIGQSKATAIISYREENGKFSSIEDLKNVSGIGDATFKNLESRITV